MLWQRSTYFSCKDNFFYQKVKYFSPKGKYFLQKSNISLQMGKYFSSNGQIFLLKGQIFFIKGANIFCKKQKSNLNAKLKELLVTVQHAQPRIYAFYVGPTTLFWLVVIFRCLIFFEPC